MHLSVTSRSGDFGDHESSPSLTTELCLAPSDLTLMTQAELIRAKAVLSGRVSGEDCLLSCTWLCDRCWPLWEPTGQGLH